MIMDEKKYFKAEIYGMCGGVHAALKTLQGLVDSQGRGVYVFNELVHNHSVTAAFVDQGVTFTDCIDDIPCGSTLVIGAHGVAPDVEAALRARAGICHDATCPLVKKLHHIAGELTDGDELIIFGKADHPEVKGVAGHSHAGRLFCISSPEEAAALPELVRPVFISQTTVDHSDVNKALEILRKRFPALRHSSGICNASETRQNAVMKLAPAVDTVLVIGSDHSSNARRLREIAERCGCRAFLVDNAAAITAEMLQSQRIGITSGASTPQYLFDQVIDYLEKAGFVPGGETA
jgi:4-hydroxy-3-methylbut-2-enyl diphosphate reductase